MQKNKQNPSGSNPKKWALVTGASSGLGHDFAWSLAAQGINVILTARNSLLLEKLKEEIEGKYKVKTEVIPADLSHHDGVSSLCKAIKTKGVEVDYLINNAGFGINGYFADQEWSEIEKMLRVNIVALTEMTKYFVGEMKRRNSGHILLVASVGAYTACPTYAAYGATKAYVLSLGEALRHELMDTSIKISVLSPGPTATNFMSTAGQELNEFQKKFMMDSSLVVQIGIDAMLKGGQSVIPGFWNKMMIFSSRFMSREFSAYLAHRAMK